jgi:hypothetical protein
MKLPAHPICLHFIRTVFAMATLVAATPTVAQDFNDDGSIDSVIAAPYEDVYDVNTGQDVEHAGAVTVLYGKTPPHLPAQHLPPQQWTFVSEGILGSPEAGDLLGFAVAWGRFNPDEYWDLAIGLPGRDVDGVKDAGSVLILYGSAQGLVAIGARMLQQGAAEVPAPALPGDNFGYSLAASYFWHHGLPNLSHELSYLAIGAPGVTAGSAGAQGRGKVVVLYPEHPAENQVWQQTGAYAKPGNWFGFSLAIGDFGRRRGSTDASGLEGLAIGVPGEDANDVGDAGAVDLLFMSSAAGLPRRLDTVGQRLTPQGLGQAPQRSAMFGFSLAAGNLTGNADGDYSHDLAIGEPFRNVGSGQAAGAVHVVRGDEELGLQPNTVRTITQGKWMQGSPLPGTAETGDWFGFSVSIGRERLFIGSPGEDDSTGSVHVLRGGPNFVSSTGATLLDAPQGLQQFGWSVKASRFVLHVGAPQTNGGAGAAARYGLFDDDIHAWGSPLTQDGIVGLEERSESGDAFGASVGAGGLPRFTFTF